MSTSPPPDPAPLPPVRSAAEQAETLYSNLRRQPRFYLPADCVELVPLVVELAKADGYRIVVTPPAGDPDREESSINLLKVDGRPHSRACGVWADHDHGSACSRDCPTCHKVSLRPPLAGSVVEIPQEERIYLPGEDRPTTASAVLGAGGTGIGADADRPVAGADLYELRAAERQFGELRAKLKELLGVGWFCRTAPEDGQHYAVPAEHLWPLLEVSEMPESGDGKPLLREQLAAIIASPDDDQEWEDEGQPLRRVQVVDVARLQELLA